MNCRAIFFYDKHAFVLLELGFCRKAMVLIERSLQLKGKHSRVKTQYVGGSSFTGCHDSQMGRIVTDALKG